MTKEENNYGKAYAFFNTSAPKDVLPLVVEDARDMAQTPRELELILNEGFEKLNGDSELMTLAKEAEKNGMKYVFEAKYRGATNKKTADEVADILNSIYNASAEIDPAFGAKIVYQDMGKYVSRN